MSRFIASPTIFSFFFLHDTKKTLAEFCFKVGWLSCFLKQMEIHINFYWLRINFFFKNSVNLLVIVYYTEKYQWLFYFYQPFGIPYFLFKFFWWISFLDYSPYSTYLLSEQVLHISEIRIDGRYFFILHRVFHIVG